jgi:hypothetical protein
VKNGDDLEGSSGMVELVVRNLFTVVLG